jgi:hypothetical protein
VRVHEVQVAVRGKVINDQVGITTIVRHRQQGRPISHSGAPPGQEPSTFQTGIKWLP